MRLMIVTFVCAMPIACICASAPAFAQEKTDSSWNGTWAGNWANGNGTQIVFSDNDLIAFYWNGDYVSDAAGVNSHGNAIVTIAWQGGTATLTRLSGAAAHIVVHEKGKPDLSFALKRDD